MKIVAIDASPSRGVVSLTVEAAARSAERSEATVSRVRLAELRILSCTGCGMCRYGEGCKIGDDLPALVALIAGSDGVIIGLPAYFGSRTPGSSACSTDCGASFRGMDSWCSPVWMPIAVCRARVR